MSRALALVVVAAAATSFTSANAALIYGGPGAAASIANGYIGPAAPLHIQSSGMSFVSATKRDGRTNVGSRALRWDTTEASPVELGHLGTSPTGVADVGVSAANASGIAVGYASRHQGETELGTRAVRWDSNGTPTELGNLGTHLTGFTESRATNINSAGTVIGVADLFTGQDIGYGARAVRWDAGSTAPVVLDVLGARADGYTTSEPLAINTANAIVGRALKWVAGADSHRGFRAVRWQGTTATELGNLGVDGNEFSYSEASVINASGTAAGEAFKFAGGSNLGVRPVRWNAGSTIATELSTLGVPSDGIAYASVEAINDAGTIVGSSYKYIATGNIGGRAVRWDAGTAAAVELGNLGTTSSGITYCGAFAINSSGVIVGYAQRYTANAYRGERAVLWNAAGDAVDLNTLLLPADAALWTLSNALSISDSNWVTGIGIYDPDGAGPLGSYDRVFLIQVPEPASLSLLALASLALRRRR